MGGASQPKQNCTMYVVADPNAENHLRMMKAVKDEGMPTLKNPFVNGNLFIILNIDFPQSLSSEVQEQLRALLPPPLHAPVVDADAEVHEVIDIDPVQSYNINRADMT